MFYDMSKIQIIDESKSLVLTRLMRFLSRSNFYAILEETKPQDFVSSYILVLMSEPVKYTFTLLVIFVFV